MQELHLYEYAVLRIVPRVEREEFINAGVVLYCGRKKFLQVRFEVNPLKLAAFGPALDVDELACYLSAFERICKGVKDSGTIGQLPVAERFRWLTATRSTVVQCSKVHPGMCSEPLEKVETLFRELVL